jgi:hypothetical protein
MRKQASFLVTVGLAVLATFAGPSCRREASQTEPAKTTTEGGTTTAPPAKEVAERDMALVRAVNAIPGAGQADIYADDLKAFTNLEYKTVTPYKELRDNEVTFKVQLTGNPEPTDQEQEMLMDGHHYTVFAMPGDKEKPAELKVLADELVPPEAGKIKVRVVNASADAGNVDVMVAGQKEPVISGVGMKDHTGYKEISPVEGKITLRDDQKKRVVAEVPASMESGKLYTVIVLGKTAGSPKAEAFVVQDELTAAPGSTPPKSTGSATPPKY